MRGADSGPSSGNGDETAAWARPEGVELPEIMEERAEEAPAPAPAPAAPPAPALRGLPDDTGPWALPADATIRPADDSIRAAGGVVWTRWGDRRLRILVIHRPKYDDWSLPKGKCDPGESDSACAEREVREETGLTCAVGGALPSTTYLDRRGRPKTVRYFSMQPMGGAFAPNDEVDELRWLPVDEATRLLSYEHDAAIVTAFIAGQEQT